MSGRRIALAAATGIAVCVATYVGTALSLWQANPGQWDTVSRSMAVWFGLALGAWLAGMVLIFPGDDA